MPVPFQIGVNGYGERRGDGLNEFSKLELEFSNPKNINNNSLRLKEKEKI